MLEYSDEITLSGVIKGCMCLCAPVTSLFSADEWAQWQIDHPDEAAALAAQMLRAEREAAGQQRLEV